LQKLIENVHHREKLLTLHFDINDLFSRVFKPLKNSSRGMRTCFYLQIEILDTMFTTQDFKVLKHSRKP